MKRRSSNAGGRGYFVTTRWTVVLAASDRKPQAEGALAELCQTYWVPLYAYLRHKGHRPAQAEDLVQSFFAQLIEKSALAAADPNRGRFRTFLISSLQHFVANRRDHDLAQKRGGTIKTFSLDFNAAEEAYHREPWTDLTPEKIFDRRWALDLLQGVMDQLQQDYARSGKSKVFENLLPCLTGSGQGDGYATIARELHLSPDAAKMAASRLRKRYRDLLRRTIADTVASPNDVDDEIRHLFDAFAG